MSDTPETDKAKFLAYILGQRQEVTRADFAARMERERDEARAALREAVEYARSHASPYVHQVQAWEKIAAGVR